MSTSAPIDLRDIGRALGISEPQVARVVELLDAGNTVPFITRFRKDQTGGLDEEQVRRIQSRVAQLRLLAERKQTILRSIDSQSKLSPELSAAIEAAQSSKQLEDLYLPYKPKKTTLATQARERGLELLAKEILDADPACADLDRRAADFVDPDKRVLTVADALLGAGYLLAEQFGERAPLRERIRAIIHGTGRLVTTRIETERPPEAKSDVSASAPSAVPSSSGGGESTAAAEAAPSPHDAPPADDDEALTLAAEDASPESSDEAAEPADDSLADVEVESSLADAEPVEDEPHGIEPVASADDTAASSAVAASDVATSSTTASTDGTARADAASAAGAPPVLPVAKREKKPHGSERRSAAARAHDLEQRFKDYFNYHEELPRIPPHRVLAINRGERARILRVKLEFDATACDAALDELAIPADHPHADFLRGCARDALTRLLIPSLEREIRRELTDASEAHAVEVFARNLRHLLLQPPVRGRRVLAVDPGFRSGCKLTVLDEFGNVLDHGVVHVIGKAERRDQAKQRIVELVQQHAVNVIAIGNGTACRQTEELVAEVIAGPLAEGGLAYTIVNEAGASVYSASRIGREELPQFDPTLRSTISIGRRLLDPLSELVKIEPASIGVGLYQHDVRAKHLQSSLDAVIESCVNFVGVDVNTASPALLRYVSGLNQLTARRVYDFRVEHGPFKSREQLKEVPGLGEIAFTQAAGFLRIVEGDQPLDGTWIHPESYAVAGRLLERLGYTPADLNNKEAVARIAEQTPSLDTHALAAELQVGELTLSDMLAQLARPGRDPREDLPAPIFKQGVLKLEDLHVGMELYGSVLNVVDFGAFIDIGLNDSGLVHISQLADRYVPSPHEIVAVGDIVKVWVLSVDKNRRRVSLTMIDPAIKKAREEQAAARRAERAAAQAQRVQRAQAARAQAGPPPAHTPRPAGRGRHAPPHAGRPAPSGTPTAHKPRPSRPQVPVKLTKAKREGRAPLQTFGELKKFLELQSQPDTPPVTGSLTDMTPLTDTGPSPAADAPAESAAPEAAPSAQDNADSAPASTDAT